MIEKRTHSRMTSDGLFKLQLILPDNKLSHSLRVSDLSLGGIKFEKPFEMEVAEGECVELSIHINGEILFTVSVVISRVEMELVAGVFSKKDDNLLWVQQLCESLKSVKDQVPLYFNFYPNSRCFF
jgi:hypothetical protein